jgi:hypothetical protein
MTSTICAVLTVIEVYDGVCGFLIPVGCGGILDDCESEVSIPNVNLGHRFHIRIGGTGGIPSGQFNFSISIRK